MLQAYEGEVSPRAPPGFLSECGEGQWGSGLCRCVEVAVY